MSGEIFNPFTKGWCLHLPPEVASYPGLSWPCKGVYMRLGRYAGRKGLAYPKIATLSREVGLCIRQTRAHLKDLEVDGFIRSRRRFGTSNVYEFLEHPCFSKQIPTSADTRKDEEICSCAETCMTEKTEEISSHAGTFHYGRNLPHDDADSCRVRKDLLKENLKHTVSETEIPQTQPTTTEQAAESEPCNASPGINVPSCDSYDDFLMGLKLAYRNCRGAKLDNLKAKANAHAEQQLAEAYEAYEEHSGALLAAVELYLSESSEFLRSKGWPIKVFLSQKQKYLDRVEDSNPRPAIKTPPAPRPVTPVQRTPPPLALPTPETVLEAKTAQRTGLPELAEAWNKRVPHATKVSSWLREWDALTREPLIAENLDELLSKCDALAVQRENPESRFTTAISFPWFSKQWEKLLNGVYDWALPDDFVVGPPPADPVPEVDHSEPYKGHPDYDLIVSNKLWERPEVLDDAGKMRMYRIAQRRDALLRFFTLTQNYQDYIEQEKQFRASWPKCMKPGTFDVVNEHYDEQAEALLDTWEAWLNDLKAKYRAEQTQKGGIA